MSRKYSLVPIILIALLSLVFATAADPLPDASSSSSSQDLIRLTIENRDKGKMYLMLSAPGAFYYLQVDGKTSTTFTVDRGMYSYTLYGCGIKTEGSSFDLTTNTRLVNPICGGNARTVTKHPSTYDLSEKVKLVRVHIINETDQKTLVILTGPSTHVFTFIPDQEGTYTIARKPYTVQFYACGVWNETTFTPYKDAKLVLKCAQ